MIQRYPHEGPHKYQRTYADTANKTIIYMCVLPGCQHSMLLNLIKGRTTVCWKCGAATTMNAWNIKLKRPHCQPKCKVARKEGQSLVDKALTDLFGD